MPGPWSARRSGRTRTGWRARSGRRRRGSTTAAGCPTARPPACRAAGRWVALRYRQRGGVRRLHGDGAVRQRYSCLAVAGVEHHVLALRDRPAGQAVEEAGQPVEVVLAPLLERVVVALGALQAD